MTDPEPPFRLLFVCTANQCRSPMAATLAARELLVRNVRAEVASRGITAGGAPAAKGAVKAMAARGLDLSGHRSRIVDRDVLMGSDLVITMERRHLVEIAERDLDVLDHAFTVLELTELADLVGPRRASQTVAEWVATVSSSRNPTAVLALGTSDDLPDPMGGSQRAFRRTADQLETSISRILSRLFPEHPLPG